MNEQNDNKIKVQSNSELKAIRLKYVRHLEKFHKRSIPLLKKNDFDIEIFKKVIDKYYNEIKLIQSVRLDNTYLQMLEDFVNLTLNYTANYKNNFSNERLDLLKKSNLVHKEKNKSNYKKDKHKKQSFNDGY